jgi:hypothetical protein
VRFPNIAAVAVAVLVAGAVALARYFARRAVGAPRGDRCGCHYDKFVAVVGDGWFLRDTVTKQLGNTARHFRVLVQGPLELCAGLKLI